MGRENAVTVRMLAHPGQRGRARNQRTWRDRMTAARDLPAIRPKGCAAAAPTKPSPGNSATSSSVATATCTTFTMSISRKRRVPRRVPIQPAVPMTIPRSRARNAATVQASCATAPSSRSIDGTSVPSSVPIKAATTPSTAYAA